MTARGVLETLFSFTGQHLAGAALFARKAHEIESGADFADEIVATHRAYVWSAVAQSATALEVHVAEIFMHGFGHHLGSNGTEQASKLLLLAAWEKEKYKTGVLKRYQSALTIASKAPLSEAGEVFINADLLIKTRNTLVHYKSHWGAEMQDEDSIYAKLEKLKLSPPPFTSKDMNFFPNRCLSASLASWSVQASATFIMDLYSKLQISSPLLNYNIAVPSPQIAG